MGVLIFHKLYFVKSSIGHGRYEVSSNGLFIVMCPVLDVEYMKFPVIDY